MTEYTDDPYLNRINWLQERMYKHIDRINEEGNRLARRVADLERKVRDLENELLYSNRR